MQGVTIFYPAQTKQTQFGHFNLQKIATFR